MDYKHELDSLTWEQVQSIKRRTKAAVRPGAKSSAAVLTGAGGAASPVIFAEGDSWFDFPPGVDIIDHLHQGHGLAITRFSKHGDTLDNMVYGVKTGTPQIEDFLAQAARTPPRVVLFSAGGNDVLGEELLRYLNHSSSGLSLLRGAVVDYLIDTVFHNAFGTFIDRVRAVARDAHFILHGYAEPFPSGEPTRCGPFPVAGPWIRPQLEKMRIPVTIGTPLVHTLAGRFNEMLRVLANSRPDHVTYLDLRSTISETDWRDELHLQSSAYARVADLFAAAINAILNGSATTGILTGAAAPATIAAATVHPYWEDAKRRAKRPRGVKRPKSNRQGKTNSVTKKKSKKKR